MQVSGVSEVCTSRCLLCRVSGSAHRLLLAVSRARVSECHVTRAVSAAQPVVALIDAAGRALSVEVGFVGRSRVHAIHCLQLG